jgi:LytS/YehU family sensor histidine kinase
MTGVESTDTVFMAEVGGYCVHETMFILPKDLLAERWTGRRLSPDEVIEKSGIENIEYTKLFLKIYRYRFDKNFDYTIHVSDECNDIYVPKLLLQPIVENSIKYGYKNKAQLQIKINAEVKDNFLVVIVEDDGAGIEKEELDKLNELLHKETNDTDHVGLFNTARRLILQFGEDSSIHLDSEVGCGTRITISIRINKAIAKHYREGDEVV